jgi:hypothetical protein
MKLYLIEIKCSDLEEWLVFDTSYSEVRAEALAFLAKLNPKILDIRVTPLEPELL